MESSLSERLKIATRSLHTAAERAPFMAALLRGQLPVASYRRLLVNLHAIYAALEEELDRHRTDPAIAAIWLPGLARVPSLERDLAGMPDIERAALCPAGVDYVEQLHRLGRDEPRRLIAHAYVRFLGDLSGGQLLHRIVGEKLGAPVAFYDFGDQLDVDALRAEFRSGLARLELDEREASAIVDEAVQAFDRHVALFDQLASPPPGLIFASPQP